MPTPASPQPRPLNPDPCSSPDLRPLTSGPCSRAAFTLVELLMVIAIIGMLTALVSVAAVKAINSGRNAQFSSEIGLLDGALQTYKNNVGGSYPPDSSLLAAGTAVQDRQNRMLQHLRKAFPRIIVAQGYGTGTTSGSFQFLVQQAFKYHDANLPASAIPYGPNPPKGNGYFWGDLNNLDPAEAWVFWLGGPPNPPYYDTTTGKYLYTLAGFSANKVGNATAGPNGYPTSFGPLSLTDASRDAGPYEFKQSRLGDADGDGWPEYYPPYGDVPQPPGAAFIPSNPMPPYVYFDATSYGGMSSVAGANFAYPASAAYPSSSGSGLQPTNYPQWSMAIPYAQTVNTTGAGANATTTVLWANPQKYQIICAGLDQMYWYEQPTPTNPTPSPYTLRLYPSGKNYSQGDLDNLTNLASGMLQSARP